MLKLAMHLVDKLCMDSYQLMQMLKTAMKLIDQVNFWNSSTFVIDDPMYCVTLVTSYSLFCYNRTSFISYNLPYTEDHVNEYS